MIDLLFMFLLNVVYRANAKVCCIARKNLDASFARFHIEEVVGQNQIVVFVCDINVLRIRTRLNNNGITLYRQRKFGVDKTEVLRLGEDYRTRRNYLVVYRIGEGKVSTSYVRLLKVDFA